jgi:eukaryotic-like serine/threonine-protein kinase
MESNGHHDSSQPERNGSDTASKLVTQAISIWRNGAAPDALKFIKAHPQVADQKSLVLDLAYEEYCLRKEQGESVTPEAFCEKFPDWGRSLAALIDVHDYLNQHPEVAPPEQTNWPQPGSDFLGFEIERKIGSGAFARVYVGRDPSLGYRPVVVKVSRAGASEAMTLGRLTHDNIVPVNSVKDDAETGLTAICMPYQGEATLVDLLEAGFRAGGRPQTGDVILAVARKAATSAVDPVEGPTAQRLKRQSYVDAIVGLAIRLAGALKYAHSRGVLHRDLKPSNVLLAPDGEPKVLDFNLSWDTQLSSARLGGTVPYMSPEQVRSVLLGTSTDRRGGIDQRSDLFSLGVVLYELFTGVTPFGALGEPGHEQHDAEQLLERQKRGAKPIEALNPDVDPSLSEIIMWCLDFDPADRPQTAADLEAALVRYQLPSSRFKRVLHRRKYIVWGASLAAIFGVVAFALWLATRPPYAVRAYDAGLRCYERGDWDGAAEYWKNAIDADLPTMELRFALSLANIRRERMFEAIDELESLRHVANSGAVYANLAYCKALGGYVALGEKWSERAIGNGFENAAVWNNRGYCKLGLRDPVGAIVALDKAIELDKALAVAYQNRALARAAIADDVYERWRLAIEDIECAMKLAPKNWAMCRDAGLITARAPDEVVKGRPSATDYFTQAVQRGGSLAALQKEPDIERLRGHKGIAKLLNSVQSDVVEPPRVVLPCVDPVLPYVANVRDGGAQN